MAMARTRTFIAVDVSESVLQSTSELIETLSQCDAKVRWVASQNRHVTLKFLGDQPDKRLGDICSAAQRAAARIEPFHAQFHGVGAFPNVQRPRTVWVGVSDGRDGFRQLFAALEDELGQVGIAKERRGFQPHLTIGRVRQAGSTQRELAGLLERYAQFDGGGTIVREAMVYASQLEREGPRYTVLARAPLAGSAATDNGLAGPSH
jgi:2'-5' RNA ligase